ncbi:PREDICTED: uncharacterized protein LOC104814609 [Tarenaya hassleriana]|uniref:uncharacterized protein LOC104814609 n=1 Tax=Tarenaya hassleriana TaxID=28532 RepID=UPI00053C499B|nr:PREDICTED: uncharacterized protein LOC104814609 [Tarenaya hassleriana]
MALSQHEPMNPLTTDSLIGNNFEITLNKSVEDLLAEIHGGGSNFSRFVDVFYNLMQARIDPPFESIWVYTALSFRTKISANEDPLDRVASAKGLLQFISACSGSCSSSKSIGLLAPLVFEVYKLVNSLLSKESCSKKGKKGMREVKSLIDAMLGYISACSSSDLNERDTESADSSLGVAVSDLVRVWTDSNTKLDLFFPLVSGDICEKMKEDDFDVNYLAGVVVAEMFFLKLLMEFRGMPLGGDSEKELRNRVVGTITEFRNPYFFDVLVNMLTELKLPLHTHLLDPEQEVSLRKILYDAVVLVDYSFLNINATASLETDQSKSLAISRLHLVYEAMEFCKKNKDQKTAFSYSNAFSASHLRFQIIKWIKMVGGGDPGAKSSPKDLITELSTNLQKHGDGPFGNRLMKLCTKLAIDDGKQGSFKNILTNTKENGEDNHAFYIGKEGQERDVSDIESGDSDEDEITNAALINAARSIKAAGSVGKKRKERGKHIKYNLTSSSGSLDSGSESDLEDSAV